MDVTTIERIIYDRQIRQRDLRDNLYDAKSKEATFDRNLRELVVSVE